MCCMFTILPLKLEMSMDRRPREVGKHWNLLYVSPPICVCWCAGGWCHWLLSFLEYSVLQLKLCGPSMKYESHCQLMVLKFSQNIGLGLLIELFRSLNNLLRHMASRVVMVAPCILSWCYSKRSSCFWVREYVVDVSCYSKRSSHFWVRICIGCFLLPPWPC
jgi:hypothetical protein